MKFTQTQLTDDKNKTWNRVKNKISPELIPLFESNKFLLEIDDIIMTIDRNCEEFNNNNIDKLNEMYNVNSYKYEKGSLTIEKIKSFTYLHMNDEYVHEWLYKFEFSDGIFKFINNKHFKSNYDVLKNYQVQLANAIRFFIESSFIMIAHGTMISFFQFPHFVIRESGDIFTSNQYYSIDISVSEETVTYDDFGVITSNSMSLQRIIEYYNI